MRPICPREGELSMPQVRRDLRSVDRRRLDSPTPPGEGGVEVQAACKDGAPRELDSVSQSERQSVRRESDPVTSPTNEPRRAVRRKIPPCPQCDGADGERVLPVAPESRIPRHTRTSPVGDPRRQES